MSNSNAIIVVVSFRAAKSAIFKVVVISIMSAFRRNIFTCFASSLAYSPEVREIKNFRHDFLNNCSESGVAGAASIIVLRIKSALNQFIFSPVIHLTVNLRFIPEIVSIIRGIHSVKHHRRRIEHITHSTRRIHSLITIRHASFVLLINCMTACPAIAEAHCEIIKRIYRKNSMPCNLERIERVSILCKFPIVLRMLANTNVSKKLIDNTTRLLSVMCMNFRTNFV